MSGLDIQQSKINLIISHFLQAYEDEDKLKKNNDVIADVFVQATIREKLFDEKRKLVHSFPEPDNDALLKHSIDELCQKRDEESIHNFLTRFADLDSAKYRIEIPYDDITSFIYSYKGDVLGEAVGERLDAFSDILTKKIKKLPSHESLKIEKAYKKFSRHIRLAISQRSFYLSHSRLAEQTADQAKTTANAAQKAAVRANSLYDNMMVNYITILGIFASIIITLFGGINIISASVKLLEGNAKLSYLVFVVSGLMICLMTLLTLLVKWVSSLNKFNTYVENKKIENSDRDVFIRKWCNLSFYTKTLVVLSAIMILSLICIVNLKPETFDTGHVNSVYYEKETFLNKAPSNLKPEVELSKPDKTTVNPEKQKITTELSKVNADKTQ
ncbi:hypothetical protein QDT73_03465 [Acinetobacter baumannii]|uniref:hypothetical protein n=1 Tax=Acinetobacter baumannii TaxID=470 RepID=UPI00244C53FA|nr:hypothetical protein [Acinetobacter baumannii]MDH2566418.1 hypothetical protein [Acinetobacter baumannii]